MADSAFDFQKFIADSLQVITNPAEYFSKFKKNGGLGDPIVRAVLYGTLAGLLNFIWGMVNIGPIGSWFGGMLGSGLSIMALITTIIGSIVMLFIGGIIVLILSAVCGGSTDFEGSVRVMASVMIVIPIRALIGIISGLSFFMGYIITLIISIYAVFLIYMGIVHALKGKQAAAMVVSLILAAFPVLLVTGSMMCVERVKTMSKDAEKFMEKLPESNLEMKQKVDRLKKMMEEAEKEGREGKVK